MARAHPRSPPSPARSLFLGGAGLLTLYLFGLRPLSGVTSALLLGFAGVVFAVLLNVPTAWLARRMPRSAAVVLVLVALGLALYFGARVTLPALAKQFAVVASHVPVGAERLWSSLRQSPTVARVLPEKIDLRQIGASVFGHVVPFLSGALAAIGAVGIIVAIGAFLCADPESDLKMLERLVPARHHERVHEIAHRSAALLRSWLVGMLVEMTVVGAVTSVGLRAVGVHGWLALGVLAFAGTLVPYLGAVVVAGTIFAAGLADSPKRALAGLAVYAIVQVLLGRLLEPLVARATIRTSPTLLLIFQFIMAASFGVLGVVLAQPLLAVATALLEAKRNQETDPGGDFTPA
jgi:predicted PurR-regulated permease PerM